MPGYFEDDAGGPDTGRFTAEAEGADRSFQIAQLCRARLVIQQQRPERMRNPFGRTFPLNQFRHGFALQHDIDQHDATHVKEGQQQSEGEPAQPIAHNHGRARESQFGGHSAGCGDRRISGIQCGKPVRVLLDHMHRGWPIVRRPANERADMADSRHDANQIRNIARQNRHGASECRKKQPDFITAAAGQNGE